MLRYRHPIIILVHALLVVVGYWLAFLLRFEYPFEAEDVNRFLLTLPIVLALRLTAFAWWRLHQGLWRYVSMRDMRIADCGILRKCGMRNGECGMANAEWRMRND